MALSTIGSPVGSAIGSTIGAGPGVDGGAGAATTALKSDLLASWNDTPTRQVILDFVAEVTDESSEHFVPPHARIAVFDNDGTLWTEKPLPIQLDFTVRRLAATASADETLRAQQPWKAAFEGDIEWISDAVGKHQEGDSSDLTVLIDAITSAFIGIAVEEYDDQVRAFFAHAEHPMLKRHYHATCFAPMVELLRFLEANGFINYIASGGDRDFMRPIADRIYGIPSERVIGSALGMTAEEGEHGPVLRYAARMQFFDEGPEKPVRIWSRIGRRPILACGNSNGDIPMLQFTATPDGAGLSLLLLHDDAEREFAYIAGAEDALDTTHERGWTVISMSDDWSRVFAE